MFEFLMIALLEDWRTGLILVDMDIICIKLFLQFRQEVMASWTRVLVAE